MVRPLRGEIIAHPSMEDSIMRHLAQTQHIATYGIDIGKSLFHVVGLDKAGHPQLRTKFRRDTLL